jgi:(p)ppGpp synthase/HD superfamily hydrolase
MVPSPAYSEPFERALRVAATLHHQQTRKGDNLPYITHPVYVAIILLHYEFPVEVAIAGLLHDVVEDQDYSLAEIEKGFGPQVAEVVAALTEQKQDESGSKRPWEVRKEEALEQMRQASPFAVAVKAADTLHNIRTTLMNIHQYGAQVWQRFNRGPQQMLKHYRHLAEIARERVPNPGLVQELEDAIAEMAQTIDQVKE